MSIVSSQPGPHEVSVFSELAADALKRDDTPQFLLWCVARALDQEGRGWVEYKDLVSAAEGIFSRGYLSRLIRNQKAMRFYFHWQGIGHYGKGWVDSGDDATERTLGLHG